MKILRLVIEIDEEKGTFKKVSLTKRIGFFKKQTFLVTLGGLRKLLLDIAGGIAPLESRAKVVEVPTSDVPKTEAK